MSDDRVTLQWVEAAAPAADSYIVEAGSAPGLANLAVFDTGTTVTALTVVGVGAGTYFVRVRARNGAGTSDPSNEIVVSVAGGATACGLAAPASVSAATTATFVAVSWTPSARATSYIVEAGTASGASDVVLADTHSPATLWTTFAPIGVYYVRVLAKNECGVSAASVEVVVRVGLPPVAPPASPEPTAPPASPEPTPPASPPNPPAAPSPPSAPRPPAAPVPQPGLCGFDVVGSQQLVFEGDSQTGLRSGGWDYPTQMLRSMGYTPCDAYLNNLGVGGSTVAAMAARAPAADAKFDSRKAAHVMVVWIGTNDLAASTDAATIQASIAAYGRARRAVGWKVVLLTLLPAAKTGLPSGYDTERVALNAAIRSSWPSFADRLVDVAADSRLADPSNRSYFDPDRLHLIEPGYAVVASLVRAIVQPLL